MHSVSRLGSFRRGAAASGLMLAMWAGSAASAAAFETLLFEPLADRSVPDCAADAVLGTVKDKFAYADVHVAHRDLAIAGVDRVSQSYEGVNDPSPRFRRYCEARAHLSDGKTATLYYLIEQQTGFLARSWNVEFCVIGHEPWKVHDGRCHTVRHRWW